VATFPALALSVALAEPITTLLFTSTYSDSATVLAILAVGHYVNASLGFNALTLRVQGAVRLIVTVDVLSTVIGVILSVVLIREFGALGAAIATSATMIVQNLLYQGGLVRSSIGLPGSRHVAAFASIGAAIAGLTAFQLLVAPPLGVGVIAVGAVSLVLVGGNRGALQIGLFFPELLRLPFVGRMFGSTSNAGGGRGG
jgi:O-antigen/teichoic acid export membrane protein